MELEMIMLNKISQSQVLCVFSHMRTRSVCMDVCVVCVCARAREREKELNRNY